MPVTYYTFLAGSLALAGIVPFAGFWSKDEVLYEALVHGLGTTSGLGTALLVAYGMGLIAVLFTGFYTFRMVMLTFHGEPRSDAAREAHEPGWNVKLPLTVLGILATTVGFVNMVPVKDLTGLPIDFLHKWLYGPESGGWPEALGTGGAHYHHVLFADYGAGMAAADLPSYLVGLLSLALALFGAGSAYALYGGADPDPYTDNLGSAKDVLYNNYYQDEFQVWLAEGVVLPLSKAADTFDQAVVDGVVNGVSSVSLFGGSRLKRIQDGLVTHYAAMLTLGLTVLLVGFAIYGGWF
jgi:NADH-quinone oxidoreductase subunit L